MSNQAALLEAKGAQLVVRDAAIPTPDANEVVIRSYAGAVNPLDWKQQRLGLYVDNYPIILGTDVAGIVHSVGKGVTAFQPGDRVMAHGDALLTKKLENGSFQLYPKTNAALVAKLPDAVSFEDGAVLPLALSTAAAALFQKEHLNLPYPVARGATSQDQILFVWGGSGSVGSTAIQLAIAAGFDVATTASARNFNYVRSLGAKYVFDHSKSGVVDDIVNALKGRTVVGAFDSISHEDTIRKSADVLSKLTGNKFLATTLPAPADLPADVKTAGVFAVAIMYNEVSAKIWGSFATDALSSGALRPEPKAFVVGSGLSKFQEACEMVEAGVSAKKVVVKLD